MKKTNWIPLKWPSFPEIPIDMYKFSPGSPPKPYAAGYQTLAGEAAHATLPTLNESRSTEDAAEDPSPGRASTTSASDSEDDMMLKGNLEKKGIMTGNMI